MLNRRLFLGLLGAAAVADPERLLWVPGKKKIFIPKVVKPSKFCLVRVPVASLPHFTYDPDDIGIGRGGYLQAHYELFWHPADRPLPPGSQVIHTLPRDPVPGEFIPKFPLRADGEEGMAWLFQNTPIPMTPEEYKALAPFRNHKYKA